MILIVFLYYETVLTYLTIIFLENPLAPNLGHLYDMDMSVILISEFISRQALETLKHVHQVRYEPESYADQAKLASGLINADAWIVRNLTKVSADLV